ncbi:exonuclease subunit SbcD [Flavihumibacter sp. R14]|nr:exonuclease subunit SbcD [Flavihumibacter soli]
MKILHTADWHLGKKLDRFSRLEEQKQVMEEIIRIADEQHADAVLIAGDLYDAFNPSTEAVELFYKTVKRLSNNGKRVVVAIAGNHDSPDRIEAPDPLARECGIIFAGYPGSHISTCELESGICVLKSEPGFIELKVPGHSYPLRLLLTPYANEYRLKTFLGTENEEEELRLVLEHSWKDLADKYCDEQGINMLMAHLYMMKKGEIPPEEPEDEKPILHVGGAQAIYSENIPSQIQYAALGHLHRYQVIDKAPCPVIYSSSPLSYSFGEAEQQKYVVMLEAEPGQPVKYKKHALSKGRQLYRKRFEGVDAALTWLGENPDALVELTLQTEHYLTAEDRKRLANGHDGIITIIPDVKNPQQAGDDRKTIDLNQNIEELFMQFFQHNQRGQLPNAELLELFKEVRAEGREA